MIPTFQPFDKIARVSRPVVITEKIDGTNAQIEIIEVVDPSDPVEGAIASRFDTVTSIHQFMLAGSRSKYLTLGRNGKEDNFGFAKWVQEHAEELWALGPGRHYGEWWGLGIQRGYALNEKRFSLFNTSRWNDKNPNRPACCSVVPVLSIRQFETASINEILEDLRVNGSKAAPGFMKPEGIVIYHTALRQYFKKTIEKDEEPKGKVSQEELQDRSEQPV